MIDFTRTGCLSLLFVGASSAMAQTIAIHDSAVWSEEYWLYDWFSAHHSTFTCAADGDTLIGGLEYTKIHQLGVDSVSVLGSSDPAVAVPLDRYLGAIRVDVAESSWYVYFDGYPDELLLYDFDLVIGSSTLGIWGDCGTGLTVTDIDTVMLGSEPRQRYHLDLPGRFIVEGIGSSAGLFGQLCQMFKEFSCLHVYEQAGALLQVDGCGSLSTSVRPMNKDEMRAVAYPNPTTGIVYLNGAPANGPVVVLDAMGRPVMHAWRTSALAPVALSSLASGLYTLRMGTWSVRVVKE